MSVFAWLTNFIGTFKRDERGVVAVEFGLVLPLLFVVMVGLFEFGRYLNHYTVLQQSLRTATEFAARYGLADDVGTTTLGAPDAEITNVVRSGNPDGGTARLPGWTATGGDAPTLQIRISPQDDLTYTGNDPNDTGNTFTGTADALVIRIEAQVIYQPFVTGFMSNFGKLWMTAYHEQIWIGLGTGDSS